MKGGSLPNHRSSEDVFRDHLQLRARGDVELDIERNYAPDIALIRKGRVYRGHDGVRQCARELKHDVGVAKASYDITIVAGDVAFLEWSIYSDDVTVPVGVDTFIIRGQDRRKNGALHRSGTVRAQRESVRRSGERGFLKSMGLDDEVARMRLLPSSPAYRAYREARSSSQRRRRAHPRSLPSHSDSGEGPHRWPT